MAFKVFIDANILLDFTLKRTHYDDAKKIVALAVEGSLYAYTTPSVIHIVAYWLTKAYGKHKAKEIILALLEDITAIEAGHAVIVSAVQSKMDDIEDSLQYFTAMHHDLDYFLTRDKAFKKFASGLPICSPAEFLELV